MCHLKIDLVMHNTVVINSLHGIPKSGQATESDHTSAWMHRIQQSARVENQDGRTPSGIQKDGVATTLWRRDP